MEAPPTRSLYPLGYRLSVAGVGTILLGTALFLAAVTHADQGTLGEVIFGFVFCASGFGAGMAIFASPRLRTSLDHVRPIPTEALCRSERSVLLRTTVYLIFAAGGFVLLQVVNHFTGVSSGLLPGIAIGNGALTLWNRSVLLQWEKSHRCTLFDSPWVL